MVRIPRLGSDSGFSSSPPSRGTRCDRISGPNKVSEKLLKCRKSVSVYCRLEAETPLPSH
jgi:hypothetical protein